MLSPGGGGIQNMQDGYKDHLKLLQWIAALVPVSYTHLDVYKRQITAYLRAELGAMHPKDIEKLVAEDIERVWKMCIRDRSGLRRRVGVVFFHLFELALMLAHLLKQLPNLRQWRIARLLGGQRTSEQHQ